MQHTCVYNRFCTPNSLAGGRLNEVPSSREHETPSPGAGEQILPHRQKGLQRRLAASEMRKSGTVQSRDGWVYVVRARTMHLRPYGAPKGLAHQEELWLPFVWAGGGPHDASVHEVQHHTCAYVRFPTPAQSNSQHRPYTVPQVSPSNQEAVLKQKPRG